MRRLDDAVAAVDGHGFSVTPFARSPGLSEALGLSEPGGAWVKDETGNVSGSHKARHLFGVLLQLEVGERIGLADPSRRPELAVASCGNAALAAAVVAAAAGRILRVFVPPDATRASSDGSRSSVRTSRSAHGTGSPAIPRIDGCSRRSRRGPSPSPARAT